MRTYGQFCALAKALDVIGDRWTLLIVRELLIRGEARYTDLRDGLPGIASNLLATRLRELEEAGVMERIDAPPPVATDLYRLTERGRELEAVIDRIGTWGVPLLKDSPKSDAFCSHWMTLPLRKALRDSAPEQGPAVIEVRAGRGEPVTLRAADGTVSARPGASEKPDAVMSGAPKLVYALCRGEIDLAQARAEGLQFTGSTEVLRRLQPLALGPKAAAAHKRRRVP